MFKEGDSVYLKDSAQIDVNGLAWNYIKDHRNAAVVNCFVNEDEAETIYVLVWPEPFHGGWDCYNQCLPGYGQLVAQKHLELNFEASYEVVTVPNIDKPVLAERYDERESQP